MIGPKNDAKIEETDRLDQWEESVEAVESEAINSLMFLTKLRDGKPHIHSGDFQLLFHLTRLVFKV